jgi:hypothetical protein
LFLTVGFAYDAAYVLLAEGGLLGTGYDTLGLGFVSLTCEVDKLEHFNFVEWDFLLGFDIYM